jgi:AtzE family amidohydrolase
VSATHCSAVELAAAVRARRISAVEVLTDHVVRIEAFDCTINSFTDKTFAMARSQAAAIDEKVTAGINPGPLAGVPIAVKNLIDVAGLATRAGSKIRRTAAPAEVNAPVLARLMEAGAVLLGTLNMDEFASGFLTDNIHNGLTRNPRNASYIAGGSSGGSAAAVAAGFAVLTLGSDTNGSIRVPAALCGVFGLKPSYGRIDRTGVFPFVDSLDHVGAFARSAADLTLAYDLMQDSDKAFPSLQQRINATHVAVLDGWFEQNGSAEILGAVDRVAAGLGATQRVTLPEAHRAHAGASCITAFEGGQLHKQRLRTQPQDYDPATRRRLIAGALQPAEVIHQAQRFRYWFREQARQLFERFDILLAPATPCVAPFVGQETMIVDGQHAPVRSSLGLYTQPISFIGLPTVCVPVTGDGVLPRGVQIVTAPGREALGLAAAFQLERDGVISAPVAVL